MSHPPSHPWVYSATLTDGNITLRVEVTDLKTTTGAIEITGEATQVGGFWARISCISDITSAIKGDADDAEENGRIFMDVEAVPIPGHPFDNEQDLTVFVQVSKAWVTVLEPNTNKPAQGVAAPATEDSTWGKYKTDAQLSAPSGS